jgi:regulator of replication initiation timing
MNPLDSQAITDFYDRHSFRVEEFGFSLPQSSQREFNDLFTLYQNHGIALSTQNAQLEHENQSLRKQLQDTHPVPALRNRVKHLEADLKAAKDKLKSLKETNAILNLHLERANEEIASQEEFERFRNERINALEIQNEHLDHKAKMYKSLVTGYKSLVGYERIQVSVDPTVSRFDDDRAAKTVSRSDDLQPFTCEQIITQPKLCWIAPHNKITSDMLKMGEKSLRHTRSKHVPVKARDVPLRLGGTKYLD